MEKRIKNAINEKEKTNMKGDNMKLDKYFQSIIDNQMEIDLEEDLDKAMIVDYLKEWLEKDKQPKYVIWNLNEFLQAINIDISINKIEEVIYALVHLGHIKIVENLETYDDINIENVDLV